MEDVVEDAKEAFAFVFAMNRDDDESSVYVSQLFANIRLLAQTKDPHEVISCSDAVQAISFELAKVRLNELHRAEMHRLYPQLRDLNNVELQGGQ